MKNNRGLLWGAPKAMVALALAVSAGALWTFQPYAEEGETAKFVGPGGCQMCHSDRHEELEKTMMAKAYDLLVIMGEEKNGKCIGCHATGFGKEGGFVDLETTPDMAGITCESCHGPGEKYQAEMMSGDIGEASKMASENAKNSCAACHRNFIHGELD